MRNTGVRFECVAIAALAVVAGGCVKEVAISKVPQLTVDVGAENVANHSFIHRHELASGDREQTCALARSGAMAEAKRICGEQRRVSLDPCTCFSSAGNAVCDVAVTASCGAELREGSEQTESQPMLAPAIADTPGHWNNTTDRILIAKLDQAADFWIYRAGYPQVQSPAVHIIVDGKKLENGGKPYSVPEESALLVTAQTLEFERAASGPAFGQYKYSKQSTQVRSSIGWFLQGKPSEADVKPGTLLLNVGTKQTVRLCVQPHRNPPELLPLRIEADGQPLTDSSGNPARFVSSNASPFHVCVDFSAKKVEINFEKSQSQDHMKVRGQLYYYTN